jgi:putative YphP/YqiW family bacilliredoxin
MESIYDREAVKPMWQELSFVGVESLTTAEQVEGALSAKEGTVLVVVNSVCGCAAGGARPGVTKALQHKVIPDRMVTVFAGVDREATETARRFMAPLPPSSPCVALFRNGEPVYALQRHNIESMDANGIAQALTEGFDEYCTRPGPSISKEEYEKLIHQQICSSSIPLTGHK